MAHKKPTVVAPPKVSETNWQARDDMHALKQAEMIKADPKRHQAAKSHAHVEAKALKKVAGRGAGKK